MTHLKDLTWMDVERYLQTDDRIILITGATEEHAYLSLYTDILIPSHFAEAIAAQTSVLIAPPLPFGVSGDMVAYPGTMSVSASTFDAVLTDVVDSLFYQGFRGFFFLNGHAPNQLPARIVELQKEGSLRCDWYDWGNSAALATFEREHGLKASHANWGENFPFCRVGDVPDGEKPFVTYDESVNRQTIREVLGDGSFGGLYQVDDATMQTLFDAVVAEGVERLKRL